MNLNNVNIKNTREWCKFNDNARGKKNRQEHVKQYGGSWVQTNKKRDEWQWNANIDIVVNFVNPKRERATFEFTHKDGKVVISDNFTGFCKENNINPSAMHDVLSGKRKQFKGYTVKRIPPKDNGKNT
jgi:hypothetical protein